MSAFIRDNMAPLMFLGLVVFMLIGYPAAFSLAAVGLFFAFIGIELGLIEPNFLGNLTPDLTVGATALRRFAPHCSLLTAYRLLRLLIFL